MTRPFFTRERISHFDLFNRHAGANQLSCNGETSLTLINNRGGHGKNERTPERRLCRRLPGVYLYVTRYSSNLTINCITLGPHFSFHTGLGDRISFQLLRAQHGKPSPLSIPRTHNSFRGFLLEGRGLCTSVRRGPECGDLPYPHGRVDMAVVRAVQKQN